jgi:uncharacterized protein YdeI (BOF family)
MLFLALVLASQLSAAAPDSIPIAAARQKSAGQTVTVTGLVTVPSGRFRSSSGDEGFAIQDQTGGIWISTKTNPNLRLQQKVRVKGKLATAAKKLQIVADSIEPQQGTELRVATGSVGMATLGFIVTVEGKITRSVADGEYGHKLYLDDGSGETQIFVNKTTDIDPAQFPVGETIRVTGFGTQYEAPYELEPRSRADILKIRR